MKKTETKNLLSLWQTILVFVLLVCGISFILSILQTPKYKSQTRLLVLRQFDGQTEAYAAATSAEYVSTILSKVIYSSSFLDKVLTSGFNINNDFHKEPLKREKEWEKMLQSAVFSNTGILEISVLNKDKDQAEQLATAIAHVLATKGELFHGANNIEIKVIDPPATSVNPVVPNIPLNVLVGAILGAMAGIGFVYLFPELELDFSKNVNYQFAKRFRKKSRENKNKTQESLLHETILQEPILADKSQKLDLEEDLILDLEMMDEQEQTTAMEPMADKQEPQNKKNNGEPPANLPIPGEF